MENKIRRAFEDIKADDDLKRRMKQSMVQELENKTSKKSSGMVMKLAIAAICFCLVFTGSFHLYSVKAEAASIEMQGEAGIALSINKKDRVIRANGLNDIGTQILEQVNVSGMTYTEAMKTIMESDCYRELVGDEETEVPVNVECKNDEAKNEISENVQEVCRQYCRRNSTSESEEHEQEDTETHGYGSNGTGAGNNAGNGNGAGTGNNTDNSNGTGEHDGNGHNGNGQHGDGGGKWHTD